MQLTLALGVSVLRLVVRRVLGQRVRMLLRQQLRLEIVVHL